MRRAAPVAEDLDVLDLVEISPEDQARADDALLMLFQHELDDRAAEKVSA